MTAVVATQKAGSLKDADPAFATAILIDLLEGVNNHMRLGDVVRNRPATMAGLFDQRWRVFLAAMAPPESPHNNAIDICGCAAGLAP
ncbi:hypothetical protein RPMA_26470 [Tardiphaga alba]|uniref:Uncharacterized protein n=1 Tax=Tardiphaga alba TaxID=340268 RepID=A0ABX8AGC6_9BRAD|nr:hypothetical protein [Tardiphaga alba]QUS41981.1 hypothetical protein RPMA_26470 [Tardiphaga alba]